MSLRSRLYAAKVRAHIARRKREGRPLVRIEPDGKIHVTAEDLPEFRARMTPIHDEWAEVLNDIEENLSGYLLVVSAINLALDRRSGRS